MEEYRKYPTQIQFRDGDPAPGGPTMHEGNLTIASGGIYIKDGKVLLIRDSKDPFWKTPGGTIRMGESFEQAMKREFLEETGMEVQSFDPEPHVVNLVVNAEEKKAVYVLVRYWVTECGEADESLREDVTQNQWFDIHNLPEDISPSSRPAIEYFAQKL